MKKILELLESDSRLTPEQIALMCDKEVGDIRLFMEENEKNGVILGYKTIIDWDKTDREYVNALIELKITPQRDRGFDRVAERIYNYPEVQSLYLMSGSFDLAVLLEGRTMKELPSASSKYSTFEPLIGVFSTLPRPMTFTLPS